MTVPESPGRWITAAELAESVDVTVSTVSNWRRRHQSFPAAERRGDREVFSSQAVVEWLDDRRISAKHLLDDETPGSTYGGRLRRRAPGALASGTMRQVDEADRQKDALWKGLIRLRGPEDLTTYADFVLGMLYLAARHRDGWDERLSAPQGGWVESISRDLEDHPVPLPPSWRSVSTRVDVRRIEEVAQLVDRTVSRSDPKWTAEVFEDLVDRFGAAEGRHGDVMTPPSMLQFLVEALAPDPGASLLDPCLETGASLIRAARFIDTYRNDVRTVFAGQSIRERSRSIARMNLDVHGLEADLGTRAGVALNDDLHAGRRFDSILANPPFNMLHAAGRDAWKRPWPFGSPPENNANFAWLQHIWSSLTGTGRAAVVMPNGALSSAQSQEAAVRAAMVEAGAVEALIALPPQLFTTTAIPVTIWMLRGPDLTERGEVLFVDARAKGRMANRTRRVLTPDDIRSIAGTLIRWRTRDSGYRDEAGFCASVDVEAIRAEGYDLPPGRYVGAKRSTDISTRSAGTLRRELARLSRLAAEADALVNQQLDRIIEWNP